MITILWREREEFLSAEPACFPFFKTPSSGGELSLPPWVARTGFGVDGAVMRSPHAVLVWWKAKSSAGPSVEGPWCPSLLGGRGSRALFSSHLICTRPRELWPVGSLTVDKRVMPF